MRSHTFELRNGHTDSSVGRVYTDKRQSHVLASFTSFQHDRLVDHCKAIAWSQVCFPFKPEFTAMIFHSMSRIAQYEYTKVSLSVLCSPN